MQIVDGRKIAAEIIDSLQKLPKPQKKLAALFIDGNPSSASFLKQKKGTADALGVEFILEKLPETASETDIIEKISSLGENPDIGGIIIQLPLPQKYDTGKIISVIPPEKDLDALVNNQVPPLAVSVVKDVLREMKFDIKDKTVAVVGRGILIGKPIAQWLAGKCKQILHFNRETGLEGIEKADLVISGAGQAGLIKPETLKTGAGIIDFGFDAVNGKIHGDFAADQLTKQQSNQLTFYTPTPGGTGPILVAELFKNFYSMGDMPGATTSTAPV